MSTPSPWRPSIPLLASAGAIPVIHSDLVPYGQVFIADNQIIAHPGYVEHLVWTNEIRSLVQRTIKAALPDLLIPRRSTRG